MEKAVIFFSMKTFLFFDGSAWIKKGNEDAFDIPQGCLDGAEASDLVGLYMLDKINSLKNPNLVSFGLYRDDFLSIASGSGPEIDRLKKNIISIFKNEGLKIVCEEAPGTITNFLDICLNLETKGYKPYRKPGNQTLFVSVESDHPPNIIRQLPRMVRSRIEKLCNDKMAFEASKGP